MISLETWRTLTFAHPWRLWLLVLPVALALWEIRRRGPHVALPLDHSDVRHSRWLARLVGAANLLPALLLAIAMLIVAGPTVAGRPKEVRSLTNIEFLLDVSGSMGTPFGSGSRYDAAMQAISDFTHHRKGDAFGLTIFGNEVLRWTPLTKDLSAVDHATPFLRPELLPGQFNGTEIGKAVLYCADNLQKRGDGDKLIVLLTDGDSPDINGGRGRAIGQKLAANNIVLYAIKIGEESPAGLLELAPPTGGQMFSVGSPEAIDHVFAHIDQMQPVKLKPAASERVDFFVPFALAGLAVTGGIGIALCGLRYTPW
jgi:Ca-activated chloride channel family protein